MSLLFFANDSNIFIVEYILFAFLALLASAGNTIFNRLGSNHVSSLTNATIKSFFIIFACFFISLAFGHVPTLYALSPEQWLWVSLVGALTAIDWIFYFFAIKRSHLEAFSPFCASGILFASNTLFSIFTFSVVTNGAKPLNIVLYFLGLAFLLASLLYILFSKKANPSSKKLWVLYASISTIAFAFVLLIVKLKLSAIPADVIAFHQISIVFVTMFIASLVTKNIKEIKQIKWQDHLYIFIGAIFNALLMLFRYTAFSYSNAVVPVINIIIGLDFVIVSLVTVIFFKEHNKKTLINIIILVFVGMVLDVIAGLI